MNKKGFIIIWDWRFFVAVAIIFGIFLGYDYLTENGVVNDFFGEKLIDYKDNPKITTLNYGSGIINYVVYGDLDRYLGGLDRSISYYEGTPPPSSKDFILKEMNNDLQYQTLLPLVWEIRSKAKKQSDESQMAINIVQNIPYDDDSLYSGFLEGRYPYQVLYDNRGVCGEKSQLLAFLLKELGYGVAIFEFNAENHMAVGILCDKGNYNSPYCFVEATEPTSVGYIPQNYVGGVSIRNARPDIIKISDGRKYGE